MARQDGRAPARAYAMKAVEDTDAPDVIVGNFTVFDTIVVTPRPEKVHSTCNCRGTKCHCNIFGSCY